MVVPHDFLESLKLNLEFVEIKMESRLMKRLHFYERVTCILD